MTHVLALICEDVETRCSVDVEADFVFHGTTGCICCDLRFVVDTG